MYETTHILPFKQEHFYSVAVDVNNYHKFVPYMSDTKVFQKTHKTKMRNGVKHGKFDAETTIGFKGLVNFSYISKITYKEPSYIFTVNGDHADGSVSSMIFKELYSTWEITKVSDSDEAPRCRIHYKIKLTFANSLYSSVTR